MRKNACPRCIPFEHNRLSEPASYYRHPLRWVITGTSKKCNPHFTLKFPTIKKEKKKRSKNIFLASLLWKASPSCAWLLVQTRYSEINWSTCVRPVILLLSVAPDSWDAETCSAERRREAGLLCAHLSKLLSAETLGPAEGLRSFLLQAVHKREKKKKPSHEVMSYIILKENDIYRRWTWSGLMWVHLCWFLFCFFFISWISDLATGDVLLAERIQV